MKANELMIGDWVYKPKYNRKESNMKLIKKSTLFKRAEVELSEEEYKAYVFGSYFGRIEGFVFGVIVTLFIGVLIILYL